MKPDRICLSVYQWQINANVSLGKILFLLCTAGILLLATLSGCNESTAPDLKNGAVSEFEPPETALAVPFDQTLDFMVLDADSASYQVTWSRRSSVDTTGRSYRYIPTELGLDSLVARVVYADRSAEGRWVIDVLLPDPIVSFLPADSTIHAIETVPVTLRAVTNCPPASQYAWTRNGEAVGQDSTFVYEVLNGDTDIVRCEVSLNDGQYSREWRIEATLLEDLEMPTVTDQRVYRTDVVGEIRVLWNWSGSWYVPISEYRILANADGPITMFNLDQAMVLATTPHVSDTSEFEQFYVASDDARLIPDALVWFAVVAVDERGNISPPPDNPPYQIPYYWFVEGSVDGAEIGPLEEARVQDDAGLHQVLTDVDGYYRIGPYHEYKTITLTAAFPGEGATQPGEIDWHDCVIGPIGGLDSHQFDFMLIPRFGSDPDCAAYSGDFIYYFRNMTTTWVMRSDRPNFNLYKWEHFPLGIHIPDYISPTGVDLGEATRLAVQVWNNKLGQEYLIPVSRPEDAQIVMEFGVDTVLHYGLTELLEPGGGSYSMGGVIPEKVQVTLYDNLRHLMDAEVCALHELGHALGLIRHAFCHNVGYLMYYAPSVSLENWPEHAIHVDELNAVRMIRALPQSLDMSRYLPD